WEMVYWHYIACDIPIMNTPIQVFPLPFVITYDDKDECEPGCPTEHGVDAFDGSVRKPISPLDAAQRLSNTHVGALAGLQQYLPLDFYYATDVSAHAKPVAEVNANWISKHDVRLSAEGSSPYTDPAWPGYNWAGNDLHNISIWRPDGSYSVFYYVNYPGIVGGWHAAHAAEKGRLTGNGSAFVYTSANGDEERFSHGRLTKVIKRDGTRISFNRMSDEHMHYSIRKGAEPLHQASVLRQGDAQGYRYLMEYAGETYQFVFDHSHRLLRMRKPTGVADEFSEITFHYQEPANSKLLTSVTDEQGQTILRYRYDAYGRVVESATAGQGPASTIDYHADGTRTVQDSSGKIQHYQFEQDRISRVTCISCGDTVVRHRYSSTFMGKRKTTTDSKGTVTTLER
ncbi:RHS repeat domain-containing protein, partial [Alkalimonas sp. NCh-2]|uniref:RHS repeat domain-containing protein n=1 Tax=Alkalimonas sp. NCh-2 TaxID=3144846 RepID=UPI0031F67204